jgi:sialidase-1
MKHTFAIAATLLIAVILPLSCMSREDPDKLSTNGKDNKKDTAVVVDPVIDPSDTVSTPGTEKEFPLVNYSKIFTPGESGYAYFRIPAAVKTNKGVILCFAEGRVTGRSDYGNIDIVLKRSEDGGATWGNLIVVKDDGINRCCNPVPVVLPSGAVLLVYCWNLSTATSAQYVYTTTSNDEGLTWSTSMNISSSILRSGESSYLTGPVHGIVKQLPPHKGRILIPARCKSSIDKPSHIVYSDDNGATWKKGSSASYSNENENTITELANGNILMNMRNYNQSLAEWFRYDAISKDAGETFESTRMTTLIEPPSGCQGSLLTYRNNYSKGTSIVLFSNPSFPSSRRYGSVKVSYDNGQTWTKMYRYTDDAGDGMYSAYSDLVLLNNGKSIGIIYEAGYNYGGGIVFKSINFSSIKDNYTY